MSAGPQLLADIVVPENFTPYVQQITEQKARIIQSGVAMRSDLLDGFLAGGGLTVNVPSWQDLDDDADRVANDLDSSYQHFSLAGTIDQTPTADISVDPTPNKITRSQEIAARLSRNNSWESKDLAAALAGEDPLDAIATRVGYYWVRRLQAAFIATMNGVIADNVANDSGDYVNDISGASFIDGTTNFSAEAFLDAAVTMGDSMEDLTAVMVHSVVYNRMQKNNLIDFIPDSEGRVSIPTFLGREVIVDDNMPRSGQVYDTWLFGAGAAQIGLGAPKMPTEVDRKPGAGNGAGQEVLYNRVEWCIHPTGHAYVQSSPPDGGPSNTDLATATTWNRVYPERKQIKFARLVTREA